MALDGPILFCQYAAFLIIYNQFHWFYNNMVGAALKGNESAFEDTLIIS